MKSQWLDAAPRQLVVAYEENKIGVGRSILKLLLCDEQMNEAWKALGKHVRTGQQWYRVWGAIASAKSRSNASIRSRRTRGDERDEYKDLATKFAKLAKKICNGRLDVPAYELLPQDVLAALHVENWQGMDTLERCDVAHRLLPCWPRASELLRGLEARATNLADDAMNKPRPDQRGRGDVAGRTFVWYLGRDFQFMFGDPMLDVVGRIAGATFKNGGYDPSFLEHAYGGKAKRG